MFAVRLDLVIHRSGQFDFRIKICGDTHRLAPPPPTGANEDRLVLPRGMWVSVEHGGIAAQPMFRLPSLPPELFHLFPQHVRP